MGKIYFDMGFLATDEVLEISATELVGEYVGQTGPKTQKQLEKALGRVLFIDEAYRLADGPYAKEAIDEIVDCLTKAKFAYKLLVILAGYDEDIDRLISINHGLSSRFPEKITFASLNSTQCLDLLLKQLERKSYLDLGSLKPLEAHFKLDVLDRFETLAKTSNWGNARDVDSLSRSISRSLLESADQSSGPIPVDKTTVLHALDGMIRDRSARGRAVNLSNLISSHQPVQSVGSQRPNPPSAQLISQAKFDEETESADPTSSQAQEGSDSAKDPVEPDTGVDETIWTQLSMDKLAAIAVEQKFLDLEAEAASMKEKMERLESLNVEMQDAEHEPCSSTEKGEEARHRLEQERIQREIERRRHLEEIAKVEKERKRINEERRKEQAVQQRLRKMGVCVQGFRWIKQHGGYRCAGGSHYISDAQLGS